MDYLELYKDEVKKEMEERERQIFKLTAEIEIYRKVRDNIGEIIERQGTKNNNGNTHEN